MCVWGEGQERREQRHSIRPCQVLLPEVVDQPVESDAGASSRPKPRNRSKKSPTGYRPLFWCCGEQRHAMTGEPCAARKLAEEWSEVAAGAASACSRTCCLIV